MAPETSKLKIAGTWAGVLLVELDNWSVTMLREEIAKRSSLIPGSINLISGGRVLKDGDGTENLSQLGLKNNSKVLATRVSLDEGQSIKEEALAVEERDIKFARIKAAATALSKRHGGDSVPDVDFDLELEDQSGRTLQFSETDREGIMSGLMLHAIGKRLIRKQMFKDALEVLAMGEESFSLCSSNVFDRVDNIPILQIDMVWCYFMLQDITWLSMAGMRLEKARKGLENAHGKDASRFISLQGGLSPDLALYLRLELLEGVVAYYNGQLERCRALLNSAKARVMQLQVTDEALSIVMSMGFKDRDAKRALRRNNQNVESAVHFLVEEKEKKAKKREDDIVRRNEIIEQRGYGLTPLKKGVDLEKLKAVVSVGFEKNLAAEALRRNENDIQSALDELTNPETNTKLQGALESRKTKRLLKAAAAIVDQLVSMGFDRSRVMETLQPNDTMEQAMQRLLESTPQTTEGASNQTGETSVSYPTTVHVNDASTSDSKRDVEMEDEITDVIAKGYDTTCSDDEIDIIKEGEAVLEYLALLDSGETSSRAMQGQTKFS